MTGQAATNPPALLLTCGNMRTQMTDHQIVAQGAGALDRGRTGRCPGTGGVPGTAPVPGQRPVRVAEVSGEQADQVQQ
ncbi:hypothetical protein GCM10009664_56000 [Kitasatospora gansuensis]